MNSFSLRSARADSELEAILEGIDQGFYAVDRSWRIYRFNTQAATHFGIPPERALGQGLWDLFPNARDTELGRIYFRVMEARQPISSECASVVIPGRWLTYRLFPLGDGMGVVFRDVTEERLNGHALREREAELARVQKIGQVGGLEVGLQHGFHSRRSPEYLAIHGLPPDAQRESHESWVGRLHPDDRAVTERHFLNTVKGDATDYVAEYRIIRPSDGQVRWISAKAEIERDARGRALRLVGAHTDITERKLAEQALRESEERFRLIADSAPVPIWVTLLGGPRAFVNQAYMDFLGMRYEDALVYDWRDALHPDDRERILREQVAGESSRKLFALEARYRRADGAWRWLRSESQPRWGANGEHVGFIGVAHDVTASKEAEIELRRMNETLEQHVEQRSKELRLAEEQLRQAQKMEAIGQLTGGIAHDFNNLLTGILGSLDLISRRIAAGRVAETARFLEAATASANRAASLTHRLLAFSRRQSLDLRAIDVNRLVSSMEDMIRRTMGEQIRLASSLQPDAWLAEGDSNQIETALLNLVINARDAMPGGGTISVETANVSVAASRGELTAGDYVALTVRDDGCGMPATVLERAFDPFFTTKAIGQGTGLGLSMIYGYAKQSRGHAEIESQVGAGTSVRLYLPRGRGAAAEQDQHIPAEREERSSGTILVVEDDPAVRMLVTESLRELGYEIREAADGAAAIPRLQRPGRLDALVTDVGLPGMNGRQLAEFARQCRPGLKVLFMTGYAEAAAVRAGFLAPGMDLILKPFDVDALAARVKALLDEQDSV
ncbi:MAG: PAS domain S-box protein [Variibacter sp.]|nr:PAS domain S-box protein [Variibacter sp.]